MTSFQECYDQMLTTRGHFHISQACNIADKRDNLLAVIATTRYPDKANDEKYRDHDTLITFLYKGDFVRFEKALAKIAQGEDRLQGITSVAIDESENSIHAAQMHCIANDEPNPAAFIRAKTKAMVDCLSNEGLIKQPTAQTLYEKLQLSPKSSKVEAYERQ